MDAKNKLAHSAHSIAFFIHRSRVQKLYRGFLRLCQDNHEREQVRSEFKSDRKKMTNADIKEAEAILKRLQIARGISNQHNSFIPKLVTPVGRSPIRPKATTTSDDAIPEEIRSAAAAFPPDDRNEVEQSQRAEWPWQRKS